MTEAAVRALIDSYLKAFSSRDTERCLDCYAPDASLEWMMGVYSGRDSIEEWHKDRFEADLKILEIGNLDVSGARATVDVVVHSKRLAAWRLPSLSGRVTVDLGEDGKIERSKFAAKSINPQQDWA